MVGRQSPNLDPLAWHRSSNSCLLSPVRLGQDDCSDRQLGSSRPTCNCACACPRGGRHRPRIRARAECTLSEPCRVLRGGAVAYRPQAWRPDWLCGRITEFHPLSGVAFWSAYCDLRRSCAILAELELDFVSASYLLGRTIAGRLRALTLSGRAPHSFECRMDNFRSVHFWIFVRVRRALDCSAACCRDRRAHALRTATVL